MTEIESPKRKMQKKNDYQRHKLFRKIKRRRKAQAEAQQEVAEKQLKKKLKLPKFDKGEDDGNYLYKSDIHINEDGSITDIRTGKSYDGARIPEVVVAARKIPTFKDIEKQIGRKITQDEIDKIVATDPEIPLQLPNVPKEKEMVHPSATNYLINTIAGTIGDGVNVIANAAGLPRLAPNQELIETKDGDALFDLGAFGSAERLGLYALGRYGGKVGLNGLQQAARRAILNKEFFKSSIDKGLAAELATEGSLTNSSQYNFRQLAQMNLPKSDAGLTTTAENVILPEELSPVAIAHKNAQIVQPDGTINMRNLIRARRQLRQLYPDANDPKHIINSDFLKPRLTNLNEHIAGVVKTAQDIPIPKGYTRQDLVQAALGHDIGKVLDRRQGMHEQLSADMLINAMRHNGIIGVQDIKPDVIQAIAEHGLGAKAMELDPLTQALHVADVTRGATYDQAAIHAGYLFNYPREYPKWNFANKSVHDEIVQNINPVLKRYGYDTINPKSTLEEAQTALNQAIDDHRTFVRGVYDKRGAKAESYMLTDEPISSDVANGGRRGLKDYRSFYGVPRERYDGLYLSTNAGFLDEYGMGGNGGKVGIVRIPQNETSKTSNSLSERLLAGDFDVYNSKQVSSGEAGNPQSNWTLFGEPYRLQTGRSLRSDMIAKDPNVPKIKVKRIGNSGQVRVDMKPSDFNRPSRGGFNWFAYPQAPLTEPTYNQMVDRINKYLESEGLTKIKSFANTDENGIVVGDIIFNNQRGIEAFDNTINQLEELERAAKMAQPYLKDEKELRKQHEQLSRITNNNWYTNNSAFKDLGEVNRKLYLIDNFRDRIQTLAPGATKKQLRAAKYTGDIKYIKRSILKDQLDSYFEGVKKQKSHIKYDYKDQERYLDDPEKQAEFMRSQGVLPRYDHPTYNHVFTITPGEHLEDMPYKMATKNMPLGPSQIAVIGKRGEKVVDLVKELSPDEIYQIKQKTAAARHLHKPSGKGNYRDKGQRIQGIVTSRKTRQ